MNNKLKKLLPFYKGYAKMSRITPITPIKYLLHLIGLYNRNLYWYKPKTHHVGSPKKIYVGKNSSVGRDYNFFQAMGGIYIGNYVRFATNVALLTNNHDVYNQSINHPKPIIIHDYCWIGMNASILPGVELGPRTIVATGAVVNKSFPEGFCILGGVPAKVVKKLDPNLFNENDYIKEFNKYGYLEVDEVERNPEKFLHKYLDPNYFHVVDGKIQLKKEIIC
ncbi:MAG: acyltransferase [Bacteroides sp.]|nr:acyltransferase [Bacteroides sp.]